MTDTATRLAEQRGSLPAHPLDPARPEEYLAGREILAAAGLLGNAVRFAYYGLEEPPKDAVLAGHGGGAGPDRRLRAFLIDVVTGESSDVVVSLMQRTVISSRTLDPRHPSWLAPSPPGRCRQRRAPEPSGGRACHPG